MKLKNLKTNDHFTIGDSPYLCKMLGPLIGLPADSYVYWECSEEGPWDLKFSHGDTEVEPKGKPVFYPKKGNDLASVLERAREVDWDDD